MHISQIIWGTTGLIVTVAIATQTNILKNLINKVKNPPPPHGFFQDDQDLMWAANPGNPGAPGPDGSIAPGGVSGPDPSQPGAVRESWGSGNFPSRGGGGAQGWWWADDTSGGGGGGGTNRQNFPTDVTLQSSPDVPDWMKNLPEGETIYPGNPGLPGGGGGGGGAPWPGTTGGGGGGSGPNSGQGGSGGDPGIPSRGSSRQSWGSGNFPQRGFYYYFYDPPLVNERYPSVINSQYLPNDEQPNFTQPLVPPNINKEIESQEPTKKHHHKKKTQQQHDQVYTQVECPPDPNSVPCGYNCYMNGQLMTVDCTTPYNFNPYRSGGPSPPYPAPTGPLPLKNNIHPTTPGQNLQDQNSQYNPNEPSYNQGTYYLNKTWDKDPCKEAGSGHYPSCRRQGFIKNPTGDYRLDAYVTNFDSNWHDMEITSGGPGSSYGCCCGVTLGVHGPSGDGEGYVYAKTEDWSKLGGKKHGFAKYLCDDSGHNNVEPCNNPPQRAKIRKGQPVHLVWQVQHMNGGAKYTGSVNGVPIDNPILFNPASYDNLPILPGQYHSMSCNAKDPTRVRVDGAGKNVRFVDPSGNEGVRVTPL